MWYICLIASLAAAPLQYGVINKAKAFAAGRKGPPLAQPYHDLLKLLRKGGVQRAGCSAVLRAAPSATLAAALAAAMFFPFGGATPPLAFHGDAIMFFYLLGFGRLAFALGALDSGSAFCGMGSARELQFSAMAEIVIFAVLGFLAFTTKSIDLAHMLPAGGAAAWGGAGTPSTLCALAFFMMLLAENSRVPFDDPDTHLELTMIHEAMALDYAGPDFAFIQYAAALKLWLFASFLVMMSMPPTPALSGGARAALLLAATGAVSVAVGAVESAIGRFRFLKLPQVFAGALAAALIAFALAAARR